MTMFSLHQSLRVEVDDPGVLMAPESLQRPGMPYVAPKRVGAAGFRDSVPDA